MNALLGTHLEMCLKLEIVVGSPQLHGLSDTGELGYGGALFLQFTSRFIAAICTFCTFIQNLHNYTYIHSNTTDTQLLHKKRKLS